MRPANICHDCGVSEGQLHLNESIPGWATWKNGRPYDLALQSTRKSILIGYDMMPLMGLAAMRKHLESKGIHILRSRVYRCPNNRRHAYCAMVNGRLDGYSMEWSIVHTGGGVWQVSDKRGHRDLCWWSLLFYAQSKLRLSEEEKMTLGKCYCIDRNYSAPTRPRDGRKKARLARLTARCEEIFAAHHIELVPVQFAVEGNRHV